MAPDLPMLMHSKAGYLLKINIAALCYCWFKFKSFTVVPFRNVRIRVGKGGTLSGNGRLLLGIQWHLGRYMPSHMVLRQGSQLKVNGIFKIYSGHSIWINKNASLVLGSGYINNNFSLTCLNRIEIGENVAISEGVTIWDTDGHSAGNMVDTAPVRIEDNVWIGLNSTILKGVTIGKNSVIAAGSVVNRDIPAYSLAAGVPAVVKKTQIDWKHRCSATD